MFAFILAPNQCIHSVGPFDDGDGDAHCWDRILGGSCRTGYWLAIANSLDTWIYRTEGHSCPVCDCSDDDGMPQNCSPRRDTVGRWFELLNWLPFDSMDFERNDLLSVISMWMMQLCCQWHWSPCSAEHHNSTLNLIWYRSLDVNWFGWDWIGVFGSNLAIK